MKFKINTIFILLGLACGTQAYAQNPIAKYGNYTDTNPWGMGGCGVGSLFIKDKDMLPQMGASIVNGFFGSTQSIAISSDSSNCVAEKNKLAAVEQEVYITVNLSSLSKEAAQGAGEHISALAEVFGCPNDDFVKFSQNSFGKIYNSNNPNEVLKNYISEVKVDGNLAKKCNRVI